MATAAETLNIPTVVAIDKIQKGEVIAPASTGALPAAAVLSNRDPNSPITVFEAQKYFQLFDYSLYSDVDPYIEITGYEYERFKQGDGIRTPIMKVRLPLVGPVQSSYQMNYTQSDMSLTYDAIISGLQAAGLGDQQNTFSNAANQAGGSFAQTAFNALANGGEFRNILANQLGIASNGRQESSFISIGMRNHSFDWILIPRNESETSTILQIIKLMKVNMHPLTTGPGNSFLKFPTEFTISFWSRSSGKPLNVPVIPDCSLSGFNVTYNQNGAPRFHDDNTALSYRLSMSFVEGNQLTREDIIAGNY